MTCCGTVYVGLEGELMVRREEHRGCGRGKETSVSSYISSELKMLTEAEVTDEGFFDKASTNPSSPESVHTVTEEL